MKLQTEPEQRLQSDFDEHINQLLSAAIYQPVVIQCIIQYLLAAIKLQLEEEDAERQQASSNQESANSGPLPKAIKITINKNPPQKYAMLINVGYFLQKEYYADQ
jgi:hypothetical protein